MARGTETLNFTIELLGSLDCDVHAIFRFGMVKSVEVRYHGLILNMEDFAYNADYDFLPLETHIKNEAQDIYNEAELEVIYTPKG